jgi:hypothetical protein
MTFNTTKEITSRRLKIVSSQLSVSPRLASTLTSLNRRGLKLCCHLLGHRVKLMVVLDRVKAFVRVLLAQILLPLQT